MQRGWTSQRPLKLSKANADYWAAKIARNKARDVKHLAALRAQGWKVVTVWECEIKKPALLGRLRKFLDR